MRGTPSEWMVQLPYRTAQSLEAANQVAQNATWLHKDMRCSLGTPWNMTYFSDNSSSTTHFLFGSCGIHSNMCFLQGKRAARDDVSLDRRTCLPVPQSAAVPKNTQCPRFASAGVPYRCVLDRQPQSRWASPPPSLPPWRVLAQPTVP